MEPNNNEYLIGNNNIKLKPSYSFLSSRYNLNNNFKGNTNNNFNSQLLKEKIKSQKSEIECLENSLKNYDETINEVTRLNLELNKMNEILKNKNNTILEYQKLSEISKEKFNKFINKANEKKNKFQKNIENFNDLKTKNNNLIEQIKQIEKENYTLKHQFNSIKNKNFYEIDQLKNEIDLINIEYEKERKQNRLINDEKIKKNKEIIDLKTKLITSDKFKEEINNINNKYNLLEKQLDEKDKILEELRNINDDLKDKLEISTENYNQVVYEQKSLESKLNNLIDKAKKYEIIFKDINDNYNNSDINYAFKTNIDNSAMPNNYFQNKYLIRNKSSNINYERKSKSPDYIINQSNYFRHNYTNY